MKTTSYLLLPLIAAALLTSGCSWFKKEDEATFEQPKPLTDYHSSRPVSPLEVPPDLITDSRSQQNVPAYGQSDVKYSEFSDQAESPASIQDAVKPAETAAESKPAAQRDMYIERAGSQRWLVVNEPMDKVWPQLNTFVLQNGLTITREDKKIGIIETDWAQNHADSVLRGTQKYLGKWIGSLYTTGTRDKFRLRIEPGRDSTNSSEVYLTHRGMTEVITQEGGVDPQATAWQPSGSNPELEAEMLTLLMVSLGATRTEAADKLASPEPEKERASLVIVAGEAPILMIEDTLDVAWRRVGQTLDRVGFMVEDRNRDDGIYFVRYGDPEVYEKKKGFFGKLFKGSDDSLSTDEYQIILTGRGEQTVARVANTDGQPTPVKVSEQILTLLYEQLK